MKLVEDQKGYETNHIVINGNGTYPDKLILEEICDKYNGLDKIILYDRTPIKKQTGISALSAIRHFLSRGFRKFIFIVDGEHINNNPINKIQEKLNVFGIGSIQVKFLQDSFLMECELANYNFKLYCIISGPSICIEQDLARFLELRLNRRIILPEDTNAMEIKRKIREIANKKKIKKLLKESGIEILERSFPRICAVLREVENDF